LLVARTVSPDERHSNLGAGRALEPDAACVGLAVHERETRLLDSVRSGSIKLNLWTVIANERLVGIQRNRFVWTDREPLAKRHALALPRILASRRSFFL